MPAPTNRVLVESLRGTIGSRHLFTPTDLILVAVSGGPDSTALLHALHALGYKVHAANLNHGLRAEATEDATYVERFCRDRGIPVTLGQVDVEAERLAEGGSVQEVARRLRYEFLERAADEAGAAVIATAHNSDDQVETVLLNILRGTGTGGLRGIPYRRGRIVRPMLEVSRAEVESYCTEHGLIPRRDASNDSTKYARNEVRHVLVPYLQERFNSNVGGAILRLSEIAEAESEYLNAKSVEWFGGARQLDAYQLFKLPVALQRRILRLWVRAIGDTEEISWDQVETLRREIPTRFAVTLPGNIRIVQGNGWLRRVDLDDELTVNWGDVDVPITVPGETRFAGWRLIAEGTLPANICAVARIARRGDRIRFAYGRKKLSDLFNEAKVPVMERWSTPILIDAATREVLAVANLRVSILAECLQFTAERITAD